METFKLTNGITILTTMDTQTLTAVLEALETFTIERLLRIAELNSQKVYIIEGKNKNV